MSKFLRILFHACFLSVFSVNAHAAAEYPTKPISIVVANPPGGQTDVVSRIIAEKLAEKLGVSVIIENRPGAFSNIGARHVARSNPDGYTLIVAAINNFGANPALIKDMPFDPVNDFEPVVQTIASTNVLLVNPASPYHTLQDVLKAAKEKPGVLSYGSAGPGSSMFLFMEMLKSMAGVDIMHVPYQGSAPANTDLMGGNITMVFDSMPGATPLIEAGRVRPIAVSSAERAPTAPSIPTVDESGVAGFVAESWLGFAAPKGTPPEVVQKLNKAVNEVLEMPEVRDRLLKMGTRPVGGSSEQFGDYIAGQVALWKKIMAEAGIKPQ